MSEESPIQADGLGLGLDTNTPSSTEVTSRLRTRTNTAEIDEAIIHPGSVKINVTGAFIVDQEARTPASPNGGSHDTKDIRLPNHTAVVSHIAVDVSTTSLNLVETLYGNRLTRNR